MFFQKIVQNWKNVIQYRKEHQSKRTTNMEENAVKKSKRGERYEHNPFINLAVTNTKKGVKRISNKDGNRMMVVSENTGEIVAPAGFWYAQEVDKTQFVKLYVNGVKEFKNLAGAGAKVFEILYLRVQENIGKDQIWLTFPNIDQKITPMGETTFYRGMKELLDKEFIAESFTPGLYFLNPDYMWNGDRLAFVNEYRKITIKSKIEQINTKKTDIFEKETLKNTIEIIHN
jgi:hypothetical protein